MKFATLKVFTLFCGVYFLALPIVSLASECDRLACSQKCEVIDGKPVCSCMQGFLLTGVNNSCAPKDPDWKILYTNGTEVAVIPNSESKPSSVKIYPEVQAIVLASDARKDVVYWTNATERQDAVYKMSLNNTGNPEVVVNVGIGIAIWIAFDWITGNLYFVDYTSQHIAVCSQNPTNCAVIVQEDEDGPTGLALHPNQGIMFWTTSLKLMKILPLGGSVIKKAGMDGSTPRTIVSPGSIMPGSVTVDETSSRIYWALLFGDKIESSRFDGSDRRVIILSDMPIAIDILGERIFWSTLTTEKIMSSNKLTGEDDITIMTNCSAGQLVLQHIAKQPKLRSNPCEDMKCSHICVLSGPSAQCLCPAGMISNGNDCVDDEEKPKLLVAQGNMLFAMRANTIGKDVFERIPLPSQIQGMNDLVYNAINKTLIIVDGKSRSIFEYNMKTEALRVLVENVNVTVMEIDLIGENLIWVSGEEETIEVLSLGTMARAVVRKDVDNPQDIAFSPDFGTLYLSKAGKHGEHEIYKIVLDSKSNDSLLYKCTDCVAPIQLAYDQEVDGVIAALFDGSHVTIQRKSIYGMKMMSIDSSVDPIADLLEIGNQIFLVDQTSDMTVIPTKKDEYRRHLYHSIPIQASSNNNSTGFRKVLASTNTGIIEHLTQRFELHDCSPRNPKRKPCSQICLPTGSEMTGGLCWCGAGFRLDEDGVTCIQDAYSETVASSFPAHFATDTLDSGAKGIEGGFIFGIYAVLVFVSLCAFYDAYLFLRRRRSNAYLPKPRTVSNAI